MNNTKLKILWELMCETFYIGIVFSVGVVFPLALLLTIIYWIGKIFNQYD